MKLNYRKTLLLGFGFFAINIVWCIYNVAVPIYLKGFGLAGVTIGAIMAIDNVFAVILQPIFGVLSDHTNSSYGRRMPYLLIGIPLAAISFFMIPFLTSNLLLMMTSIIAMNFFMSIFRVPTVALMTDLTPRQLRGEANGVINFTGGLGATIAFFLGGMLFKIKEAYPFAIASIVLFITVIVMYSFIKEPKDFHEDSLENGAEAGDSSDTDKKGKLLSLIFILLAIFFWFAGYNAVETFFSTYGQTVLHIDKSLTAFLLMSFSGLFLLSTIPAGLISKRYGRKKTVLTGLCILIFTFISLIFIKSTILMFFILGVAGISWALININSYSMVVEITNSKPIGRYTGYYYFIAMLASIVSPVLYGYLKDSLGDGFLFIYTCIALILALFFMMLVKHGETIKESKSVFENLEHMEN